MRRLLYPDPALGHSVGLLPLRLITGLAFILHGWPKMQSPFSWMGDSLPGILQAMGALAEFIGGICLLLGFLARPACILIGITMVVALVHVHWPAGHLFVAAGPGQPSYELAAVYLAVSFLLFILGPGRISVDAFLFARKPGN